jgi:uncharacterized membrane protein YeaQ/YmgE (transglycosylase-associated protein family)
MAGSTFRPHLGRTVPFAPEHAAYLWPLVGVLAGGFASLCFADRSLVVAAANVVVALLGAGLGGLVTVAFTAGEPESGGFWTSVVTSAIGTLVALGLWRAVLEAITPAPGGDSPRR